MWRLLADHAHVLRRKASEGLVVVHENGVVWAHDGARVDPRVIDEWIDDDEWVECVDDEWVVLDGLRSDARRP